MGGRRVTVAASWGMLHTSVLLSQAELSAPNAAKVDTRRRCAGTKPQASCAAAVDRPGTTERIAPARTISAAFVTNQATWNLCVGTCCRATNKQRQPADCRSFSLSRVAGSVAKIEQALGKTNNDNNDNNNKNDDDDIHNKTRRLLVQRAKNPTPEVTVDNID